MRFVLAERVGVVWVLLFQCCDASYVESCSSCQLFLISQGSWWWLAAQLLLPSALCCPAWPTSKQAEQQSLMLRMKSLLQVLYVRQTY